jgi:putative ABC transport system ATP-binding protein
MTGIDQPNAGEVLWKGETVRGRRGWSALRRTSIGIVFQEFNLIPTLTALENVEIATFGQRLGAGGATAQARAALESTGLAKRLHHPPHRMSGGERQRVAIARSIVNQPELLVADEPTGNLDSVNAALVADLLFEISRERGMTLVLVTHSEALASRCARRAQMRDGRVAWIGANGQSDAIERARA